MRYISTQRLNFKTLTLISAAMLTGSGYFPGFAWAEPAVSVRINTLDQIAVYPESSAPAQVVSRNDSALASAVDSLVLEIPVRIGDRVKAGAVLVKLDCKAFELEAARLAAEQQSLHAKQDLSNWQLIQAQTLADQQTLPEEQVQEKRSQLSVITHDIAAYQARIATTHQQISQCAVKAPFSGVVTARMVAVGQYAARGTPLIRLLDLSLAEISAQVPSQDIAGLQKSQQLEFEFQGQRLALKLRTVLPIIQAESGTQEVRLEFSQTQVAPGAAGRLLWHNENPHVPAELLVKRGEHLGLFTLQNNSAHFHALPLAQSGRPAAVDLPASTQVIIAGQYALQDGVTVKIEP
jgi:RND family efflux transporter MFP subunit